jgi:glutamate/tyrosine decarboxylase-like PLP-dependent enzyme
VYAALRSLGRAGVADLVERCCAHAGRLAEQLAGLDGVQLLNEVVLNQVLLRFDDDDAATRAVVDELLAERAVYMGPSVFKGRAAMRISVSGWQTTESDVDAAVDAVRRALNRARSRVAAAG